jgi:hypothetical protein
LLIYGTILNFNPVAPASDCRVDFHTAIICSYKQVQALSPAMPQRIEGIFTSMRSDLLQIITRWEQSGQGEGGINIYDTGDDEEQHEEAQNEENSPVANDEYDDHASLSSNEESSDLLGDDQLVFYKHELHFSTVDRRMLYTSGRWLIAINCSSFHCSALVMAHAHQMHPPSLQAQHQARAVLVAVILQTVISASSSSTVNSGFG